MFKTRPIIFWIALLGALSAISPSELSAQSKLKNCPLGQSDLRENDLPFAGLDIETILRNSAHPKTTILRNSGGRWWHDCVGAETLANGTKYVGEWRNNERHGRGTLFAADGSILKIGVWEFGNFAGSVNAPLNDGQSAKATKVKVIKNQDRIVPTQSEPIAQSPVPKQVQSSAQSNLKNCPTDKNQVWDNCFGTYTHPDGAKYVGEFRDNKKHGQGTSTLFNGEYVGEWKDDRKNGHGTFNYFNGAKYVGDWKDGKEHGQGVFTRADGAKYVGEWEDGKKYGQGTLTFANGDKYVGAWRDDKYHGQGTYIYAIRHGYPDPDRYIGGRYLGEFKDGKRHGQGAYISVDGGKYVGGYQDGKRHGQGTLTHPDGSKYKGEFRDGLLNGPGTYTFADGRRYVGAFKDDNRQGQGTLFAADDSILERGVWENDIFVKAEPVAQSTTPQQVQKEQDKIVPIQRKVALVIGNADYTNQIPLKNPKNDALAMSKMLKRLGFTVVTGVDLSHRDMAQKVREFVQKAKQADLSLFFYAGHGIQVAGQNYLIPVDAVVEDATALDFELVNVSAITNNMGGFDKIGVVFLDACRDNPFSRSLSRSIGATRAAQIGNGLAPISTSAGGLLVGFATAPNDVAVDGDGVHSPFTSALLKHLPTAGMEIQRVMTRVKAEVIAATKNDQRPWHNSDLATDVFLVPPQ